MDVLIFGPLARMVQTLVAASPTILVGWVIAAIFERILGREGTFKLFGANTWRQLPYAWLLGMLLPVCSLGVIPVMVQMRRSGIAGGTILAFGLTAPLFNPISVLYGLTLSDPFALFVFCMCSLAIVTVMGVLWDWLFPRSTVVIEPLEVTPHGWRRVCAVALSICEQAYSKSTVYILIALLGVGLLSMVLPAGCLQRSAGKDDLTAPLTMAGVATLAYITPMVAIVQVASMFQHGNSIGAAFTLLVLGTGVNLGLLAWTVSNYRLKPALTWLGCLLGVVLILGYAVDRPLRPAGVEPADHTHGFDVYCNPFPFGTPDAAAACIRIIRESAKLEDLIAAGMGLAFLLIGAARSRWDPNQKWMQSLMRVPPSVAADKQVVGWGRDIVLPKTVIAITCFVGLIAASAMACFLYYPPRQFIREEMSAIQADLTGECSQYQWEKIAYWIPIQEDWARKLEVSAYLRGEPLSRYQQMKLQVFLNKLELLEHAAEDKEKDEVDRWKRDVNMSFLRLKRSLEKQ